MREFGPAAYREVLGWPYRLIVRGVQIERQREAASQLTRLRLSAVADGMEQGKIYVAGSKDPPPDPNGPRYDLKPYKRLEELLDRQARPWEYTLAKLIARREAEEAADFDKFEQDIARAKA